MALSVLEALGDSFSRVPKSFPGSSSSSFSSNSCALSVASSSSNDCPTSTSICKWEGCDDCHDVATSGLLSHIQTSHVYPQLSSRKTQYTCLWRGCKVFGQPSVSSNWLSRHVLRHSEARGKPFQCIFEHCVLRFSSTALLERHIARDHSQENGATCAPKSLDLTSKSSAAQQSVSSSPLINKHAATVKSCSRKSLRKRRKFRCYRAALPQQPIPLDRHPHAVSARAAQLNPVFPNPVPGLHPLSPSRNLPNPMARMSSSSSPFLIL
ncbi:unnamed protein product [Dibothriocephalus latus]|uniref:C2H2-type domain-containing protein n=1 Tax=Dibothriocephalus latus TaxID=60516 RepID=A0A3P7MAS9_DIBLA|nr:unnamed protein product [Dibothriocephalus latus]